VSIGTKVLQFYNLSKYRADESINEKINKTEFIELIEANKLPLYRLVKGIVKNEHDIQDAVSEETTNDRFFSLFALFDDKGNSLDVLNTDLTGSRYGKVTNSYEFIKANKETKFITLVPIEWEGENIKKRLLLKELYNLPVTLDISKNGKIIIQDIQFDNNAIKINYKKDGVVVYDPGLNFYDEKGNEIDLGETYLVDKVDRENGTYTEIRTFSNNNVNLSKIKKIGFYSQDDYKILRDQAIKIDFK
jgi:hypothetical protein